MTHLGPLSVFISAMSQLIKEVVRYAMTPLVIYDLNGQCIGRAAPSWGLYCHDISDTKWLLCWNYMGCFPTNQNRISSMLLKIMKTIQWNIHFIDQSWKRDIFFCNLIPIVHSFPETQYVVFTSSATYTAVAVGCPSAASFSNIVEL